MTRVEASLPGDSVNRTGQITPMMSRILVTLQVVFSASLVLAARPSAQHVAGIAICMAGVAVGVWAIMTIGIRRVKVMPDVHKDARLTTSGPYRYVRHPMYTALLTACLGLSLTPYAGWKLAVWGALTGVLVWKARIEEGQLRGVFPQYQDYAAKTKRFIPFLW